MSVTRTETNTTQKKSTYKVDLPAMMAVCDANYWRLLKLIPALRQNRTLHDSFDFVIPAPQGTDNYCLTLKIVECCPYTTVLELTETDSRVSSQEQHWGLLPQLKIRVYHDAQMAEVIAFQQQQYFLGRYDYPNNKMYQQDEKAQLNVLLAEWLTHCLQHGHSADEKILQLVTG